MAVRLSICIATFNRARFIGETLQSILPQAADDVEVVVVDGASRDDTEAVVRHYEASYPCLRYIRLPTNSGIDKDFDQAVGLAQGDYCWLMADDDLFKAGAVQRVCEVLASDPSLVVVNADICDATFSSTLVERRLAMQTDRLYSGNQMDALFTDTIDYLNYIGGVVIKRSLWLERDRETYFGSLFIHVGVIFQAPLPASAIVIADPLVSIRYGNAMWVPRSFEIWMFKWPELLWSLAGVSEAAKRRHGRRDPWQQPKTLLILRAKGAYSRKEYDTWIQPRSRSAIRRWAALVVAQVPGTLANLMAFGYFTLLRSKSALTLADLKASQHYFMKRVGGKAGLECQ